MILDLHFGQYINLSLIFGLNMILGLISQALCDFETLVNLDLIGDILLTGPYFGTYII